MTRRVYVYNKKMTAWFDKYIEHENEDVKGILNSTYAVHRLIDKEINDGIPSERIILAGFGQGGAVALYAAFSYPKMLGGIIALSTWLPMKYLFNETTYLVNRNIPILQCHGRNDPVVPHYYGEKTAEILKKISKHAEFKTYEGAMHTLPDDEIKDINDFLGLYSGWF